MKFPLICKMHYKSLLPFCSKSTFKINIIEFFVNHVVKSVPCQLVNLCSSLFLIYSLFILFYMPSHRPSCVRLTTLSKYISLLYMYTCGCCSSAYIKTHPSGTFRWLIAVCSTTISLGGK